MKQCLSTSNYKCPLCRGNIDTELFEVNNNYEMEWEEEGEEEIANLSNSSNEDTIQPSNMPVILVVITLINVYILFYRFNS